MQIKLLVSAAAIALVAGLASASAADRPVRDAEGIDQFTILSATPAEVLTTADAAQIRGRRSVFNEGENSGLSIPTGPIEPVPLGLAIGWTGDKGTVCKGGTCANPQG